jgi:hypothetical protein
MSERDVRQKHVLGLDLGQATDYTAQHFHVPNPDYSYPQPEQPRR